MKNQSGTIKTNLELDRMVKGGSGGYRRLPGGSDDFSLQTELHHNIYIIIIINNSSEGENVWPGTVLTLNPGLQGADQGPWGRYQHPLDMIFQISQINAMTKKMMLMAVLNIIITFCSRCKPLFNAKEKIFLKTSRSRCKQLPPLGKLRSPSPSRRKSEFSHFLSNPSLNIALSCSSARDSSF